MAKCSLKVVLKPRLWVKFGVLGAAFVLLLLKAGVPVRFFYRIEVTS